mmetsp:Transcript_27670/g.32746  ORF Transcript_27670/g.32746 Transcript_27670/m.32746 type:complete len:409 (+) Transcript_27670:205-1431(+)
MMNRQKNTNSESAFNKPSIENEGEMMVCCNPSSKKKRRIQSTAATTAMKTTEGNTNNRNSSLTHKATVAQSVPPLSSSKATTATKYANRYEPDKPLTRPEDIKAWRNAARRKRNRESAEKSRNKVRDRIIDLEDQVEDYKSRYLAVLETIRRRTEEEERTATQTQTTQHPYSIVSPMRGLSSSARAEEFGTVSPFSSTDDDEESFVTMRTVLTAPPFPSLVEFGSSSSPSTSIPPTTTEKNVENSTVKIEVVKLEDHQNVIEITSRPAMKITNDALQQFTTTITTTATPTKPTKTRITPDDNDILLLLPPIPTTTITPPLPSREQDDESFISDIWSDWSCSTSSNSLKEANPSHNNHVEEVTSTLNETTSTTITTTLDYSDDDEFMQRAFCDFDFDCGSTDAIDDLME